MNPRKLIVVLALLLSIAAGGFSLFEAGFLGPGRGVEAENVLSAQTTVPVHFWVSNQSLGTGISSVQMTVALDGGSDFVNQLMAVDIQHTIAEVDQNVSIGSHDIDVFVGSPYSLSTSTSVSISGETWVLVAFFFDPMSAHVAQHTPTIQVTLFSSEPGIK